MPEQKDIPALACGASNAPTIPLALAEACGGIEIPIRLPSGQSKCWLIRRSLRELCEEDRAIAAQYAAVLRGARQRFDELEASAALCHAANSRPDDLLFFDLETCGLAGTAIFLVGVMFFRDEDLIFEQYLARDYSEEPAICQAFADKLASASLLVSFNGKAFDMNQLRERCVYHSLTLTDGRPPPHLDLLQESRRRWRKLLPNCRLQTLEQYLCNRRRSGDIPGWAIPDAYHRFVQTLDARPMKDILHHNMLDLLTMAQLLCAVLTGAEPV